MSEYYGGDDWSEYYGGDDWQSARKRHSAMSVGAKWHPVLGRFVDPSELRREKPKPPDPDQFWDLPCDLHGLPGFERVSTNGRIIIVWMKESLRGQHMELLDRMTKLKGPQLTAKMIMEAMRRDLARVVYTGDGRKRRHSGRLC